MFEDLRALLAGAKQSLPGDLSWDEVETTCKAWWKKREGRVYPNEIFQIIEATRGERDRQRSIQVHVEPSYRLQARVDQLVENFHDRPEIHQFRQSIGRPWWRDQD